MTDETELVTVYRSADSNAGEDAKAIQELLLKGGFDARLFGDDSPGVVEGAYEVRVPQAEGEAAEALIGERATADDPIVPVDPSHYLDLVTVAMTDGTTGEMEAMAIKSVLDANEIDSVIVGNSTLPTMGFEVRVAEEEKGDAEAAIAEARAAGAEAAAGGGTGRRGSGLGDYFILSGSAVLRWQGERLIHFVDGQERCGSEVHQSRRSGG